MLPVEPRGPSDDDSKRTVFFSDVHVDPALPEKTARLLEFLERLRAERCARAYILGDLFNFWVGRGHEALAGYREVVDRLRALADSGCAIAIVHGNRDFHLGDEVARASGARIIPEGLTVRLGGRTVHLSHGDRLCLRDTSYQAMRRAIRSAPARTGFLALPLATRLRIGRAFRRQSARSVTRKTERRPKSFSIAPSAVRRLFRDGADLAIVGHVHHARRIALEVDGRRRVLFTLGSWDDGNRSWLDFERGALALHDGPLGERVLVEPLGCPS